MNEVLRKVFGPNKEESIGGWTKLHDKEEICNLYSLPLEQLNQGGCDVWDTQYACNICSLFTYAASSLAYTAPNNRKINEKIGNDMK
jgi:hypothetical protein